jgi:hypothetical protein
MNRQLENTLIEALDLLDQGLPVVIILSRYPDMTNELRPYLVTAAKLARQAKPSSAAAEQASKRQFLQQAVELQHKPRKPVAAWLRQIIVSAVAVLLLIFMGGAMLIFASSEAIPGDTLYSTKRFLEMVRLTYSANTETAASMIEGFRQERVDEVAALLSLDRHEMVTFSGTVENLTPQRWIVEGIPVVITSSTIIADEVEAGFLVQVTGMTAGGVLLADQVEIIVGLPKPDPNVPPLSITPSPTPSPSPSPTVEPVKTPERPDILQPDDDSETNPPAPLPTPTATFEDGSAADDVEPENEDDPNGHEGDGDDRGQQAGQEHSDNTPTDQGGDVEPEEDSEPDGGEDGGDDHGQQEGKEDGDNSSNEKGDDRDDPDDSG